MTEGRGPRGGTADGLLEALAGLVAGTLPLPPCAGSARLRAVHASAARGVQAAVADLLAALERLGPPPPGGHRRRGSAGLS
ncbi:hypothetical protein [Cumulibacter manganitolerans]|uniref:hypothetical protein n=1 Tax=Cumulibacter manganitolerans TaxID=1884992 RepID=UPI0012961C3B|nr:hypothetical protein [Cumulibacter manganitolerans]